MHRPHKRTLNRLRLRQSKIATYPSPITALITSATAKFGLVLFNMADDLSPSLTDLPEGVMDQLMYTHLSNVQLMSLRATCRAWRAHLNSRLREVVVMPQQPTAGYCANMPAMFPCATHIRILPSCSVVEFAEVRVTGVTALGVMRSPSP